MFKAWSRSMRGGMDMGIDLMPDQHAFVMLGKKTLFLCHLTMFHMQEHMFQVVLRATLPDEAMKTFLADSAAHPDETYFLGNTNQDLMTVPSLKTGERGSFIADIFRGIPKKKVYDHWPWDGVTPLVASVRTTIDAMVYYRHFDFNLQYPQHPTYVIFGSGAEAHLTHYQVREPDFDHILSLREAPAWLPGWALQTAVHLDFPEVQGGPQFCAPPLQNGSSHTVQYAGQLQPVDQQPFKIDVSRTYWFSTKILNAENPCPDDKGEVP
jgi:hypothetical protein